MKDFFHSRTFKILLLVVLILLGLIIFTANSGGSFISNIFGFVSTPMQRISTNMTAEVTEFLDWDSMSAEELKEWNQRLSEENRMLIEQLLDYEDKLRENEQLRTLLEIKEENSEVEAQPASVVGRDPNDIFYGFAIDKGYIAGISVGDPVMTDKGLVGIVDKVYATTSSVTCILSEDLKVSAISKIKDESGVITSNALMAGNGTLRMNYLSNETAVEAGTIITTSGAGGIYPKDLVIGYVESVHQSESDISKYAIIRPYEDLKNVKDVYVITGFPGKDDDAPNTDYGTENGDNREDGEPRP